VQVRQFTVQPRRPGSYSRHPSSSGRSLSPAGPRQSLATPNPQGLHPEQRAGGGRWSAARQGRTRIARRRQAWCAALGCGGSHGRAAVAQGPDPVTGSQSQPMTQFERNRTGQAGPSGTAGLALSTSRPSNRFDSEQLATVQFRTSSVSQVRATVTLERYLPHCHAARAEYSTLVGEKRITRKVWNATHSTAFSAPAHPPLKAWDNKLQGHFRIFKSSSTLFRRPLGPDTVRSPTSSGTSANGIGDQERAKVYHVHRRLDSSAPPHCQRVLRLRRVDKSGP